MEGLKVAGFYLKVQNINYISNFFKLNLNNDDKREK